MRIEMRMAPLSRTLVGPDRAGPAIRAVLALAACTALSACGIFDTRTPEAPEGPIIEFITPVDRESIVLTNLEVTLEAKEITNYERSIYDDGTGEFYYLPPPADEADFLANFPDGYDRADELNVVTANLSTDADLQVTWGTPSEPVPGEEEGVTIIRNLEYQFVFVSGEEAKIYSGTCNLFFKEGGTDGYALSGIEDLGGSVDNWTRLRLNRSDVMGTGGAP